MIKVAIMDTVPMPISRHSTRFLLRFTTLKCTNDTLYMSTLYFVLFCRKNVDVYRTPESRQKFIDA